MLYQCQQLLSIDIEKGYKSDQLKLRSLIKKATPGGVAKLNQVKLLMLFAFLRLAQPKHFNYKYLN